MGKNKRIEGVVCYKPEIEMNQNGWSADIIPELGLNIQQMEFIQTNNPGVIDAYHWHNNQKELFFVISGLTQIVLYDQRNNSPTKGEYNEFILGDPIYPSLFIPEGVVHGYQVLRSNTNIICMHNGICDPNKLDKQSIRSDGLSFRWERKR